MFRRHHEARVRIFRGKLILASSLHAVALTETGRLIWDALDGDRTVGDVAALLQQEYEIGHQTAQDDVLDFLASLAQYELVEMQR